MKIYCCECKKDVDARLTDGREIYPNRKDLFILPFWKCDVCGNYVGCHHKTENRTKPLGVIPNKLIREYRKMIHNVIDPLWKNKTMNRKKIYNEISNQLGYEYHTAELKTTEECKKVIEIVNGIT
jgi:hypothetical protein